MPPGPSVLVVARGDGRHLVEQRQDSQVLPPRRLLVVGGPVLPGAGRRAAPPSTNAARRAAGDRNIERNRSPSSKARRSSPRWRTSPYPSCRIGRSRRPFSSGVIGSQSMSKYSAYTRAHAVLKHVAPPAIRRRVESHVIGDEVEDQPHPALSQCRGECVEFPLRTEIVVERVVIDDVVPVCASARRLEQRGGITGRHAQRFEVGHELAGVGETELSPELQSVGAPRKETNAHGQEAKTTAISGTV